MKRIWLLLAWALPFVGSAIAGDSFPNVEYL